MGFRVSRGNEGMEKKMETIVMGYIGTSYGDPFLKKHQRVVSGQCKREGLQSNCTL